jgi:hypothetical protein
MKAFGLLKLALGAGVIASALSCTDRSPVGPPAAPSHDLVEQSFGRPLSLLKCKPLSAESVTQEVGPFGGVIQVGPHTLRIPEGALSSPVTITATLPADTVNRVHFEPEGLTFDAPVWLTLSYANCQAIGSWLPRRVVYTNAGLEILEILFSLSNPFASQVTGQVTHFSDYAVAW